MSLDMVACCGASSRLGGGTAKLDSEEQQTAGGGRWLDKAVMETQCDNCFTTYNVKPTMVGKRVKCKSCGTVFTAATFGSADTQDESLAGRNNKSRRRKTQAADPGGGKKRQKRRAAKKRKSKRKIALGSLLVGVLVLGLSIAVNIGINVHYAGIFHRGRGVPALFIISLLTSLHVGLAWPVSRTGKSSFSMSVFSIVVSLYYVAALVDFVGMLSPDTRLVFLNNRSLLLGCEVVCFFVGLIPAGLPIIGWKMVYAGLGVGPSASR